MSNIRHLLLYVPSEWSNDDKGNFYEEFIVEILKPMRLRSEQRLRVTGMEIDILARGEDRPSTILVECKAHRDPISADVITKLMGNVHFRRADQGWLFSTSDLTKDGRGLWEEIQRDSEHARKFVWYSPARTIDVLISQKSVVDPLSLIHLLKDYELGDWSLIVTPGHRSWLVELLEDGIPSRYGVFDAKTGFALNQKDSLSAALASPRYAALQPLSLLNEAAKTSALAARAPVARVISGDAWEDPRPARPVDFVGRDDVIKSIYTFIDQVRAASTSTRSFSVLAPSGWGKSSLALKLVQNSGSGTRGNSSITAVDSRSANSAAFVAEALRLALKDALSRGASGKRNQLKIHSLRGPIDSPDIRDALKQLRHEDKVAVLIFDQFEELFAKESLFEVFNAVRDLTLDIDSEQAPLVLGFAWKTDVSLPQQHPAYHLWHQLADRRKTFKVGEFKKGEIERIVSKAERAIGKKLSRAVRSRLAEQCQGLPWLLKKLLVHVLQRVSTPESQYLLLERELDIEQLFKEDLEQLKEEHLRCLKFVASRAPIAVAEVDESFSRDTTNLLINQHLLVRSGMNYVVYWDIFRDYLVEEKVPHIPWARTFQRMPPVAVRALEVLEREGALSASSLGAHLSLKEGPTFNMLGDLVALQLVDADGTGNYRLPSHLSDLSVTKVATVARNQLRRHVVTRAIERIWTKDHIVSYEAWIQFFDEQQPRNAVYSDATLRQYAGNLKGWLLFAGLLELRPRGICRADGTGAQMGMLDAGRFLKGLFLGGASPSRLQKLLKEIAGNGKVRAELEVDGLRNAIADAAALGLVDASSDRVARRHQWASEDELIDSVKKLILRQSTVQLAIECLRAAKGDRSLAGSRLAREVGATWKPASATRVLGGLLRYATWANDGPLQESSEQHELEFQ